jgi:hypothetical protein
MAGIQSGRKLPLSIVGQAALFPFENFMAVARLGLPPALISAAILYAASLAAPLVGARPLFRILTLLLEVIVVSVVAVGIHRLILRAEQPEWAIPRLRDYELAYGATVMMFAAMTLVMKGAVQYLAANPAAQGLVQLLDKLIGWLWSDLYIHLLITGASPGRIAIIVLLVGVVIWPAVRFALVFPHAAVTGQVSFGVSWAATRGNFWRLIGVIVLLSIILYLLSMAFGLVIATVVLALKNLLGVFIVSLLGLLWIGLQFSMFVALISYIYKDLIQGPEPIAPLPDFQPTPQPKPET